MGVLDPLVRALGEARDSTGQAATRLATVTGTSGAKVLVQFDGEATPSSRPYVVTSATLVATGDRVVMLATGSTWVVLAPLAVNVPLLGGFLSVPGGFSTIGPGGATSGSAFTVPAAGTYLFDVQMSGFTGVAQALTFTAWVDGVFIMSRPFFFNQASTHTIGPRLTWTMTLTAGQHYLFPQFSGSSDNNDFMTATWQRVA